jgi:cbb3-type cytochrome oxidase subunit 3
VNPVFKAAADAAEGGWLMGVMTAVFLAFFMGWVWWVFRARNKARLEAAARMPFDDDDGGET